MLGASTPANTPPAGPMHRNGRRHGRTGQRAAIAS